MTAPLYRDESLHDTVKVICDLITQRIGSARESPQAETDLRYELVACLLGSQVRAESADAAVSRLSSAGLLYDDRWRRRDAAFEADVAAELANRRSGLAGETSYRFPQMRARQLAQMRVVLRSEPLTTRLASCRDIRAVRAGLVRDLPGIGPKQASMFLRNVGKSYDVAILDVHVLKYFHRLGLLPEHKLAISTLKLYEKAEAVASRYAIQCGHPVGFLDWAIWITMRAAKEIRA